MITASDDREVILVDADDVAVGTMGKLDAHRRGLKHRAISALVHNSAGEFLLQQRSTAKYHSGGLWTNACCSHPMPGESPADAAQRRLLEEMGVTCPLKPLFRFSYRAEVPGDLIEDEVVHVFGGLHDGPVQPDPAEVEGWKWITLRDLNADMRARPDAYTVWFRQYMDQRGATIADWIAKAT
jgi:isopentenyl-diphosphate Delta-isomerase